MIMYAIIPVKIVDPGPGILEHLPSIFSSGNLGLHAETHKKEDIHVGLS